MAYFRRRRCASRSWEQLDGRGRSVLEQAVARGYDVLGLARDPDAIRVRDRRVEVRRANVLDADTFVEAIAGADALISTLGTGASRAETELYSRGAANELAAMAANGIGTLAVIAAAPVGARHEQPLMERRIAMPILDRLFGFYEDMRRMEATLRASDVAWISLRPPRLVAKAATMAYRMDTKPLPKGRKLTYADLARALLDAVADPLRHRQAWYVAN